MDVMKSILTGLVLPIVLSSTVFAHKVNIFAYVEDNMVHTESYFNDGKKAINSTVEVFDAKSNKLLLTGKTDKNGEFSFKIPCAAEFRIILTASMGHKNEYLLSEDEVRDALGMEKEKKQIFPDNNQLETVLEEVVRKKTAPIMKKLIKIEKQMQKPSLQGILGGIGYILGLMGIIIYFRYRPKP